MLYVFKYCVEPVMEKIEIQNPKIYDPPSPMSILDGGKFDFKKPKHVPERIKEKINSFKFSYL